jgi:hypothetical protein
MAVALVQEFAIDPEGDRSTTNYDAIQARLDTKNNPPEGGIFHSAGFDEETGVFRFFDVWETREQAQRLIDEQVMPGVEALTGGESDAGPPTRQYFYELHDIRTR